MSGDRPAGGVPVVGDDPAEPHRSVRHQRERLDPSEELRPDERGDLHRRAGRWPVRVDHGVRAARTAAEVREHLCGLRGRVTDADDAPVPSAAI